MDKNPEIDLIEKYLNFELSIEDAQALESRIEQDETLAAEFEQRQMAHKMLDFVVVKNLKEQLQGLEEESKVVSIHQRRRRRIYTLSIAASVLVLIGVFSIFLPGNQMTGDELAGNYYSVPDFSNQRGTTDAAQISLNSALDDLASEAPEAAIEKLEAIPDSSTLYLRSQYYLAHAYYLTEQFSAAEQNFQQVANSQDLRLQEEAEWYALLSCLAQNNDCADKLVRIQSSADHTFAADAQKIAKRLK